MRRKLTFWRALAVVIAIAAIGALAARFGGRAAGLTESVGPSIARVKIDGLIRNDDERTVSLDRLARSSARAVIVRIDSPGGTTAGAEQLHGSLRKIAEKKPVVVVVDGLAASGGYIAAMAGERIIARDMSLVGSIGVLFQYPNFSDLLDKVGVKMEAVKSSPLKAAPNGFEPTSPEARAAIDAIVRDAFEWFKGMVRDRRHLEEPLLARASDGRVFTGRQALELKLVDELGDEKSALAWLEKEKGIDAKTPVRDWTLRPRLGDLKFLHLSGALNALGLSSFARMLEDSGTIRALERANLDGLLAVWHPPGSH
jgi:protease-4